MDTTNRSTDWYDLLNREHLGAFPSSTWENIEFDGYLLSHDALLLKHMACIGTYGYSVPMDAFLCLTDSQESPTHPDSDKWDMARSAPAYAELAEVAARGRGQMVSAVLSLTDLVVNLKREEDSPKPGSGRGQNPEGNQSSEQIQQARAAESVADAVDSAQQVEALMEIGGLGLGETPDERINNAIAIQQKGLLKRLVAALGWAKRLVSGASRDEEGSNGELLGYRFGGWDSQVLPSVQLAVSQRDPVALAALSENALVKRRRSDLVKMGKGPVVILRDESGSMRGDRHRNALTLEMALAGAFRADGRDLVTLRWSSSTFKPHAAGPSREGISGRSFNTVRFNHGQDNLLEHLESFLSGNTILGPAVLDGLEVCDEYVSGADILVITDGEVGSVSIGNSLSHFREEGGKVWCILVGDSSSQVVDWADGSIHVRDLDDLKKIEGIIRKIASRYSGGKGRKAVQ